MSEEIRFVSEVVGLTFVDGYPGNLLAITENQPATLVRNPANQFDANAIEVHGSDAGMVGHIPKDLAAQMAPAMDSGTHSIDCTLLPSRVNPDHADRPGISVLIVSNRLAEVA